MNLLLAVSRAIDRLNATTGRMVYWLILAAVLISAGNATTRYLFNIGSNAWLEAQWYLFSAVFLLCSGYALLRNDHVRIDVISGHFSKRTQTWIDIFGTIVFLLPMAIIILWLSWPAALDSFQRHEISSDAGGLVRWPVKLLIPVGFFLLTIQGFSELIKRIAFLAGYLSEPITPSPPLE
ncbi:MAG: TRAP transporter small permease subunit [Alphaproteobacteria bacterium]|nr:TRAP transporter small permease subunit [Alphaproteobacteria bacterium]